MPLGGTVFFPVIFEWGNSTAPSIRYIPYQMNCDDHMFISTLRIRELTPEEIDHRERERIFAALLRGNPGPHETAR